MITLKAAKPMFSFFRSRPRPIFYFIFVVFIAVINVFLFLDSVPIKNWDESRHAVSAFEMLQNSNYFVNTFNGQSDYWNVKPVLSFWPMVLGFNIFGVSSFGLRFFSALATLGSATCIFLLCKKHFCFFTGLLSVLILLTARNFIAAHNARSGDPDAVFIFFYVLSLTVVLWDEKSILRYYIASFLLALAFLTKSFHAIPLGLTLIILLLLERPFTFRTFLHFCGCFIVGVLPVGIWVFVRYQYDGQEFFRTMILYDLVKRSSETIEGHQGKSLKYVSDILKNFRYWLLAALGAVVLVAQQNRSLQLTQFLHGIKKRISIQICIIILIPFFLFSFSSTKLSWYTYCTYPFIAIIIAHFFIASFTALQKSKPLVQHIFLFLFLVFFIQSELVVLRLIYKDRKGYNGSVQEQIYELRKKEEPTIFLELYLQKGDWEQKDVFLAKMYDAQLETGGIAAFEESKGTHKHLIIAPSKK